MFPDSQECMNVIVDSDLRPQFQKSPMQEIDNQRVIRPTTPWKVLQGSGLDGWFRGDGGRWVVGGGREVLDGY